MQDLAKIEDQIFQPVASKYGTEKAHEMMAAASNFMPRVQLVQMSSNLAKKRKVSTGGIYVVLKGADNVIAELGESFSCLILSWRPKALRFDGSDTKAFYNPDSSAFKEVEQESQKSDSGCVFGPEYLIFTPDLPDENQLLTFHFNNTTMRMSASPMRANLGRAVTCRVELIEKKQYSWHAPVVTTCSTPLNLPELGSPERDALTNRFMTAVQTFNNPKEEEVEIAPAGESARER